MTSRLFRRLEELQGERPWGRLLDAGTGTHSIQWVSSLKTESWTAVTGAAAHAAQVHKLVGPHMREADRILLGNWRDPALLDGESYDTVLADYLLGAVDGFAPYFQPQLFERLRPLVRGRLYVIGLEPYVVQRPGTTAGDIIWEIGRLRDACLIHAGEMPYREYPLEWVLDHLARAGFEVTTAERFPIRYKPRFIHAQLDMLKPRLARLPNRQLAQALADQAEQLRERALAVAEAERGLRHGHDYLVAADPR